MNEKIEQLQQELFATLKQAARNRRKTGYFRALCYGGSLLYFLGVVVMLVFVYSSGDTSFFYSVNPDSSFFEQYKILIIIASLFLLITIGSFGLSAYLSKYATAEQNAVRRIFRTMFPDARIALLPSEVSTMLLQQSNFFGEINNRHTTGYSYGLVIFENGNHKITVRDMVLHKGRGANLLSQSLVGSYLLIFNMLFKGLFSKRVENIAANFRGMFADAQLEKKINGSVVVLPDHLESKFSYLAKNIQALKSVNGNKLVQLEDIEFERYFVVYASDEILARYVLTPAMMLRMTALKKKYNRDIMLSFNGNRFFFAVAMPEGFLTLGHTPLTSGETLNDLYDNILTTQELLNDLKLN